MKNKVQHLGGEHLGFCTQKWVQMKAQIENLLNQI
jgi:hypothetical protein